MDRTIIPPQWKILPNTMGLVYLADLNFMIIDRIYMELDHEKKNHPHYQFLLLSASNAFFESVGILHTLLCSTKSEELRIESLLLDTLKNKEDKIIKESMQKFHDLQSKFKTYNFHKVRHQAGAHKNKMLPYPTGSTAQPIQKKFIDNLGEVISILKENTLFWFNYSLGNPYGYIIEDLDKILSVK